MDSEIRIAPTNTATAWVHCVFQLGLITFRLYIIYNKLQPNITTCIRENGLHLLALVSFLMHRHNATPNVIMMNEDIVLLICLLVLVLPKKADVEINCSF